MKLRSSFKTKMVAGAAMTLAASLSAPAQNYSFSQIAVQDSAPFGDYFEPGSITNVGQIAFGPALATGGESVFLSSKGQLTAIAEGGQPTPDGGIFGYTLSPVSLNQFGNLVLAMTRDGIDDVPSPTGLNAGVYRYTARTGLIPVMVPGLIGHGGNRFFGSSFFPTINNRGTIAFPGMICTTTDNSIPTEDCPDGSPGVLALGLYAADPVDRISVLVQPGDAAPGGGTFDFVTSPGLNDGGDLAFSAHIFGELCGNPTELFCDESLYIKRAATGVIESIAHYTAPSPVPGKNYSSSFGPTVNLSGDVAFTSDLSVAGDGSDVAIFLYSAGQTITIAKSGDRMPGGGILATGGFFSHDAYLNNIGQVVFDGTLTNGDNGVYVWNRGIVRLVAKTGTDTGFGTISTLDDFGGGVANTQVAINDFGQILFAAKFQEGGGALILATP